MTITYNADGKLNFDNVTYFDPRIMVCHHGNFWSQISKLPWNKCLKWTHFNLGKIQIVQWSDFYILLFNVTQ